MSVTMPSWHAMAREERRAIRADTIDACSNGLLHVPTRTLIDHDPSYFNAVSVPFPYQAKAPRPDGWLRFLGQLWPDDPEAIDALGEFFGYVVSGRLDLHKIMLIIGPTRAGKGVIARILKSLVGQGNSTGPTLSSLGTNFGLQPLIGKPLAIISDARLGDSETNVVVERLLSISGEDMLPIDRKYKAPWTGTLPTRFMVISNELPRFGDASGAIANRFIVLTLKRSWLGHEDPALTAKLLPELPGILSWALDGLDRLEAHGYMSEPRSSQEAKLVLADLVSPVSAFIRDRCETGPGEEVAIDALFGAWKH
jgi:putative DNA primase/helicase